MRAKYHVNSWQRILFIAQSPSFKLILRIANNFAALLVLALTGCAYQLGSTGRSLPGGYHQIVIPIFKNLTMEPAVEVTFTNALIKEFERSKIGRIVEPNVAEVSVDGEIKKITYKPSGKKDTGVPNGSVLATTYDIEMTVSISVHRKSDGFLLWQGDFARTRSYSAPQVTLPGVNTVNPLYNLSARRQNFDILASDLMAEAHDRLTENF